MKTSSSSFIWKWPSKLIFMGFMLLPTSGHSLTVGGPITASAVSVSGDITVSSMTVSSMTTTGSLSANGIVRGMKGLVLQTVTVSTTTQSDTTSTSLTNIPGLSASISLSNAANYVRVSLSGMLLGSFNGSDTFPNVALSIARDSTDLGQGAFLTTNNVLGNSVGLTVIDTPGDTSSHTYSATFKTTDSSITASFTANPIAVLLLEEVSN